MTSEQIELSIKYQNMVIRQAKETLERLFVLKTEAEAMENNQISIDFESLK